MMLREGWKGQVEVPLAIVNLFPFVEQEGRYEEKR